MPQQLALCEPGCLLNPTNFQDLSIGISFFPSETLCPVVMGSDGPLLSRCRIGLAALSGCNTTQPTRSEVHGFIYGDSMRRNGLCSAAEDVAVQGMSQVCAHLPQHPNVWSMPQMLCNVIDCVQFCKALNESCLLRHDASRMMVVSLEGTSPASCSHHKGQTLTASCRQEPKLLRRAASAGGCYRPSRHYCYLWSDPSREGHNSADTTRRCL